MMSTNAVTRYGRAAYTNFVKRDFVRSLVTDSISTNISSDDLSKTYSSAPSIENDSLASNSSSNHRNTSLNMVNKWVPEHLRKRGPNDYVVLKTTAINATVQRTTSKLGAVLQPQYHPKETLWNPPKPEDVTLEMLMAAQTHFGHQSSLWNPMNQRYIYGIRHGIHIISLEVTAAYLRRAAKIVEDVCYRGGIVLFVGTKKGQAPALVRAAELSRSYYLFERWQPGTITNGDQILMMCKIRAIDPLDNNIEGFEEKLENWTALKPDLVVCLNPMENYVMLHECGTNNIPTIGVIDTNADPTWVTYAIPANDDSLRASQLISGVLGRAGEAGQIRRLADAAEGKITWKPDPRLGSPQDKEAETTD